MRCDDARLDLSAVADGEPSSAPEADLDAHVRDCADCRRFAAAVRGVRARLRIEPVDRVPDLAPAVLTRLFENPPVPSCAPEPTARRAEAPRRRPARRRTAFAAAAAAVAGVVAGATFVGLDREPTSPAAADVPARVVAGQADITAVEATYTVTEPGPTGRTLDAHLTYRAPEALALRVRETTPDVPSAERAQGALVVAGDRWWHEVTRQCSPAAGLVRCPAEPVRWSLAVTGREPFSDAAPIPLDLVVPVDAFTLAAAPPALGTRTVAGRRAIGITVTAAQAAGLLDGLSAAVDLRPVHPGDPVELWLDDHHLVPLAVVVRAGDDPARAAWAAATGGTAEPGDVVLRVEATRIRIDDPDVAAPAVPDAEVSSSVDAGFRPAPEGEDPAVPVPVPASLPDGFAPYRAGTMSAPGGPAVGVRTWTDGRAWVSVRATDRWPGGRLFGDVGDDVRPVDLGPTGRGYASADGRRIGLHSPDLDVVVAGSLPPDELRSIAAGLGLVGEPVPDDWAEARTADGATADAALPGRLTAGGLAGFGPPALRVTADTAAGAVVTEARSGPGDRAFLLTQRPGDALPPPSVGDEVGIEVRGAVGRYSAAEGELAWVEAGTVCSLRSDALTLGELAAIAERLEPA